MHSRCCWPPESAPPGSSSRSRTSRQRLGPLERLLDQRVLVVALDARQLQARRARSRGCVMAGNGFGFWNTMPMRMRTCCARMPALVDVVAVEEDLAVERGAGDELVHAVEQAQERRLAAARRADERGDLAGRHHEVDALEHEVVAEPRARVARLERGRARAADRRSARSAPARRLGRVGSRSVRRRGSAWSDRVPADVGHERVSCRRGRAADAGAARRAAAASDAVTADEAGDGEQREHDEHQHQRAGEAARDRRRRRACGCCGRRTAAGSPAAR